MREDVVQRLGTAIAAVHQEGAVVGVHVCGNTDWPMVIEAGADVINYDAYAYGRSILVYAKQVGELMARGGALAWGIVPSNDQVRSETVGTLATRFFSLVDELAAAGVDRGLILRQSMITPACGLGSLPVTDADRAVQLLAELATVVQNKVR